MNAAPARMGALGLIAKIIGCALLAYWGLYAVVAPVTNIDSQMYHLARLELALRGGLFDNPWFTSVYDLMWPWTFDAVHLPFLELGWGYALPGFACLAGTCFVVHAMLRARFGPEAAWVAVAGLLGLTCLVYQGTSTKNDIPLVFCGAAWAYARWRWRREGSNAHLFWMVLAVGFMAGAKTTGALYAIVLSAWMLWDLRSKPRLLGRVVAGLAVAVVLFGSGETYLESARVLGHPLGPPDYVGGLKNSDGVRGGVANLSRYIAGSIYLGPTPVGETRGPVMAVVKAEQSFLTRTGLRNRGMAARTSDSTLFFFQSGLEELSGFGPVGTLAMATMLAAALRWRPRALWWRLAAVAFAGLLLVSFTVGYSYWGNRYLIGWYALGSVACVCALWEHDGAAWRFLRGVFAVCAMASAAAAPLLSFNRGPAALVASLAERDHFETSAYPLAGRVRERLRVLHRAHPAGRVYFVVCNDSLVLPLLRDPGLGAVLVTPDRFLALTASGQVARGDLVIEDYPSGSAVLIPVEEVTAPDIFSKGQVRKQIIYTVGR